MVTQEKRAQSDWDRLLAEQANSPEQVGTVAPASFMKEGDVLGPVNETNPAPMRVSSLRFKGYVEVWDTVTGVKSLQPWWLLWQTMKKKRPDGSLVFTRTDPKIKPNYGADLVCYMNPASSEYERVKGMGFKPCTKQHIPHHDGLMRHVKKSHARAWEALEREREERIREEDRQLQRDMLAEMTKAAARGVSAPAPSAAPATVPLEQHTATCDKCGTQFSKPTRTGAAGSLRFHKLKWCKGEVNAS